MIKKTIYELLASLGYKLIYNFDEKRLQPRNSIFGVLNQIQKKFKPDVIFDIGAAKGSWSAEAFKYFPTSYFYLFEPIHNFQSSLKSLSKIISKIKIFKIALNSKKEKTRFYLHPDLVGSSLKKEIGSEFDNGKKILIKTDTLDNISKKHKLKGKCLIKLDVQGAELDVLKGAKLVLKKTEVIIMEVSLISSMIKGNDLFDYSGPRNLDSVISS